MGTLEDAMLLAWQHGRTDARAGSPEKSPGILALLPTQDERDAYLAAYRCERKRIAERQRNTADAYQRR